MNVHVLHRDRHGCHAAVWTLLLGLAGVAWLLAATIQADVASSQDPENDAFNRVCRNCHEPDAVLQRRRVRAEWEGVIKQMVDLGAIGSDHDFSLILRHLLRDYGKVDVNGANADDLVLVLGLSPELAKDVVAYRQTNSKFKDFDALLKVPGIEPAQLETRRVAILFGDEAPRIKAH